MQSKSIEKDTSPKVDIVSTPVFNVLNEMYRMYDNYVIASSVESLYLDAGTADVYFVFDHRNDDGTSERIPAHKNLLSITSDVFRAMFYGEWKVNGDVKMSTGHKKCPQTASAFKEFLQYFYLNKVKLTAGNVVEVMGLGHRYNVINCFNACVEFVSDNLTIENVCTGYGLAILYEQNELKERCERVITLNTGAVFNSASFLASDREILANILRLNLLSCTETDVFIACMSWIKAVTKQDELSKEIVRTKLDDLFYEIRFTSMTVEEFCLLNIRYGQLFTFDEYKYIIQKITLPKLFTSHPLAGPMFNNSPRQAQWVDNNVFICYRPIEIDVNAEAEEMVSMSYQDDDKDQDEDDDEMSCDETSEESFDTGNIPIKDMETTIFSTTKLILLGKFVCACVRISEEKDSHVRELKSNLPIQVKIVERPGIFEPRNIARPKTLVTFTTALEPMKRTAIILPKPLLIRPGHSYEIRMQQSSEGHCFEHHQLKTKVSTLCGTTIRFHDDRLFRGKPVGLIQELLFNTF